MSVVAPLLHTLYTCYTSLSTLATLATHLQLHLIPFLHTLEYIGQLHPPVDQLHLPL